MSDYHPNLDGPAEPYGLSTEAPSTNPPAMDPENDPQPPNDPAVASGELLGHRETREKHLDWCKRRALQYVNAGDLEQAFSSMCSDLMKHPENEKIHKSTNELGFSLLFNGHLNSKEEMTKWIQGYN